MSGWELRAPNLYADYVYLNNLYVYDDKLYAGTWKQGTNVWGGRLIEYNDIDAWVEKAPPLGTEDYILSLHEYEGDLYAGTGVNALLRRWNGINAWIHECDKLGTPEAVWALQEYNGDLYGGMALDALLYKYDDISDWDEVAGKPAAVSERIADIEIYQDGLWAITTSTYSGYPPFGGGKLLLWNDVDDWVIKAPIFLGALTEGWSLKAFRGKLYGGINGGRLLEYNGIDTWVQRASDGSGRILLVLSGGRLYGVGGQGAIRLLLWDEDSDWIVLDDGSGVDPAHGSLFSAAEYQGNIFAATTRGQLYQYVRDSSAQTMTVNMV